MGYLTPDIAITLGILVFMTIFFVWEKIPLALTSMIALLALILTGVLEPAQAFGHFVNPNIIIFFTMFIVGASLFETGAAHKIGEMVLKIAKTERQAIVLIAIAVSVATAFLSNTGMAAVFIPIVMGVASKGAMSKSKLLMVMAVFANMAGSLTLIGTPSNLIVHSVLYEHTGGYGFGFFEFSVVVLPMVLVSLLYFAFIGYQFLPVREGEKEIISEEMPSVPKWKTVTSVTILAGVVLAMVFSDQIGIPLHVVSSVGAALVVLLNLMTEAQAYKAVDFSTIFLFIGTLALAQALEVTGTGQLIADAFIRMVGYDSSPFVLLLFFIVFMGILTQFMSNTAVTALFAPLALTISVSMGADPRSILMATAIGGTMAYLSPVATPPMTMIYGIGGFKFIDYIKVGLPVVIIRMILALILLPIFFPFFP